MAGRKKAAKKVNTTKKSKEKGAPASQSGLMRLRGPKNTPQVCVNGNVYRVKDGVFHVRPEDGPVLARMGYVSA